MIRAYNSKIVAKLAGISIGSPKERRQKSGVPNAETVRSWFYLLIKIDHWGDGYWRCENMVLR